MNRGDSFNAKKKKVSPSIKSTKNDKNAKNRTSILQISCILPRTIPAMKSRSKVGMALNPLAKNTSNCFLEKPFL